MRSTGSSYGPASSYGPSGHMSGLGSSGVGSTSSTHDPAESGIGTAMTSSTGQHLGTTYGPAHAHTPGYVGGHPVGEGGVGTGAAKPSTVGGTLEKTMGSAKVSFVCSEVVLKLFRDFRDFGGSDWRATIGFLLESEALSHTSSPFDDQESIGQTFKKPGMTASGHEQKIEGQARVDAAKVRRVSLD